MKSHFLLLGLFLSLKLAGADPGTVSWSPAVAGLRGHLAIEPTHDPDPTEPTYKVILMLENVGVIGNLGKISQPIILDYVAMAMNLEVKDANGLVPPPISSPAGNRWSEIYALGLPPDGVLSFPVAWGGEVPPREPSGRISQGRFLRGQNDLLQRWVVRPAKVGKYFISGTVDCSRPLHATLEQLRRETPHAWHGTLVLPPIELPQN